MGASISAIWDQGFPPKSKFTVDDIPDLTGKVMIVTGGNTGIGKETVKALLAHNAKVYMASRNQEKAEAAINDLKSETGKEAIFLKLDLASLKSVKAAAEEFKNKETQLHVLFNNGGVMFPPPNQFTEDGYDLEFGTNAIGHFYLTKLLIPLLKEGAKTSPDGKARIVTTSSIMHVFVNGLDFDTFKDGPARRNKFKKLLYPQSKYGDIVLSTELARRYGEDGIVSTVVNPGNLDSDLTRHMNLISYLILSIILHPVPKGALTQLWAGTSQEGADFNGEYLKPWARLGKAKAGSQDPKQAAELWEWLEEQVKDI